jgi:hypothetical protein
MKTLCIFLFFIVSPLCAAPKIVCDTPVYSFGKIESTEKQEHTFIIKNIGDQELIIDRVKGCCGAEAMCCKKRILPGETTTINVKVSFIGRRGNQRKKIYIKSNDPDKKYYKLILSAEVYTAIFSEPRLIEFKDLNKNPLQQISFMVMSLSNINFSVTNVFINSGYINISFNRIKNNEYKITLDTIPPVKKGLKVLKAKVYTDNKQYPYITVPVRTSALQDIMVMPAKVKIIKSPFYKAFVIRSRSNKKFKVTAVDMPVNGLSYKVYPLRTSSYKIVIKGKVSVKELSGKSIIIKTDAVDSQKVEIEIL